MVQPLVPPLPVAVLAGGLATRMRPLTHAVPKSMLEVAGKPFIHWQLRHLAAQGVQRVVLCVGHFAEQIQAEVGDGRRFGLAVAYSHDGPQLVGTGGALKKAATLLGEAFFVLYGDSLLPIDWAPVQQRFVDSAQPALMTVLRNQGQWDRSNVWFEQGRILRYDKREPDAHMSHIDYGLGVLRRSALCEPAQPEAFDLADLYHRLSLQGQLAGFEVTQRFYEIGSPQGLADADAFLRANPGFLQRVGGADQV